VSQNRLALSHQISSLLDYGPRGAFRVALRTRMNRGIGTRALFTRALLIEALHDE
jgi:hypothetical protein